MRGWARLRAGLVAVVTAAGLAACATLPTQGPVELGSEAAPEQEGVALLAQDPRPDDSPEAIVRGFVDAAMAGVSDRYDIARKFLTTATASTWNPNAGLTVVSLSGALDVTSTGANEYTAAVKVVATVDADGVYAEAPPGTQEQFPFTLVKQGGQWRIDSLKDGVVISTVNFGSQYRRTALYYLSPDFTALVPDLRYFPSRGAATSAVRALLAGPVDWLAKGVGSAFPSGTTATGPVTVSDGVAAVPLSTEVASASPTDLRRLMVQLNRTLLQLPQVRTVRLTVNDQPLVVSGALPDLAVNPAVDRNPTVISGGLLGTYNGTAFTARPDAVELPNDHYADLAVGFGDTDPAVAIANGTDLVALPTATGPETVLASDPGGLAAPSYDRTGWVWTAPVTNTGTLLVARPGHAGVETVSMPALAGTTVRQVRVSREGTRIVVVGDSGGQVFVEVAAIVRGGDGVPKEVSDPAKFGRALRTVEDLVWVDEQTLGALGVGEGDKVAVHLITLGGPVVPLLAQPETTVLAAARGSQELWLGTEDGRLYDRSGNSWRALGGDLALREPTFPG